MYQLLLITTILFHSTYSSDYCAWNHAITPRLDTGNEGLNLADTFNWINGEYNRDTSFSSGGQTELYLGMPYYKMVQPGPCWVQVVYLFRFINSLNTYPNTNQWVIAGNMGTSPPESYAYCTATSANQTSPNGVGCDGHWMVRSSSETFALDQYFKVRVGGCPQVTCQTLTMSGPAEEDWLPTERPSFYDWAGDFEYDSPNIYKQTNNPKSENTANGGTFYLYWNYKVWQWAVNAYIADYDKCDSYRTQDGAEIVSAVMEGDYLNSMPNDGSWFQFHTGDVNTVRVVLCTGTVATPAPTAQHATIPTKSPEQFNICDVQWANGGLPPSRQADYDYYCKTPSPVVVVNFNPTRAPHTPGSPTRSPVPPSKSPTPGPTVTAGNPSRAPTLKPTDAPVTPRPTPGPTVTDGNPSRSPTLKPTDAPGAGTGDDDDDDGSDGDGNGVNQMGCNVYLVCVVVALFKLVF